MPGIAGMTAYEETIRELRALSQRAGTAEDVLFCEHRPVTSLEARFAGLDALAECQRRIEDEALRALKRLVDGEEGYETALEAVEALRGDATNWLRAVLLARSLETLDAERARGEDGG